MEGTRMLLELTNRKGRLPRVKVSKTVIYKYIIIIIRKKKRLNHETQMRKPCIDEHIPTSLLSNVNSLTGDMLQKKKIVPR